MGTRSLTIVKDEGAQIACIYNQFDGYPTGIGHDIKKAFAGKKLVNGYSDPVNQINGMGDLAARLVVVFKQGKNEAGGTYLQASSDEPGWAEYIYTLEAKDEQIHLTVASGHDHWSGPLDSFEPVKVETEWAG